MTTSLLQIDQILRQNKLLNRFDDLTRQYPEDLMISNIHEFGKYIESRVKLDQGDEYYNSNFSNFCEELKNFKIEKKSVDLSGLFNIINPELKSQISPIVNLIQNLLQDVSNKSFNKWNGKLLFSSVIENETFHVLFHQWYLKMI